MGSLYTTFGLAVGAFTVLMPRVKDQVSLSHLAAWSSLTAFRGQASTAPAACSHSHLLLSGP